MHVRQASYDEDVIIDDDDGVIYTDATIPSLTNNECDNITYRISTCTTSCTIYVEPTIDNLSNIINTLSISDKYLKN